LLREKIVATASNRMVVVCDGSKLVSRLGRFALPVEVTEFGHVLTAARIQRAIGQLGYTATTLALRQTDGAAYRTDGGNVIYDCAFGSIGNAGQLAAVLKGVTGVVEHGLFIGLATALVVAHAPDQVEILERTANAEI
jgi:ribose 5-phosphate isomerase A